MIPPYGTVEALRVNLKKKIANVYKGGVLHWRERRWGSKRIIFVQQRTSNIWSTCANVSLFSEIYVYCKQYTCTPSQDNTFYEIVNWNRYQNNKITKLQRHTCIYDFALFWTSLHKRSLLCQGNFLNRAFWRTMCKLNRTAWNETMVCELSFLLCGHYLYNVLYMYSDCSLPIYKLYILIIWSSGCQNAMEEWNLQSWFDWDCSLTIMTGATLSPSTSTGLIGIQYIKFTELHEMMPTNDRVDNNTKDKVRVICYDRHTST